MAWVYIEIDEILRETDKAFLAVVDGEEVWLPFSQVSKADVDMCREGETGLEIAITEFIAEQKGLA